MGTIDCDKGDCCGDYFGDGNVYCFAPSGACEDGVPSPEADRLRGALVRAEEVGCVRWLEEPVQGEGGHQTE